jgi:hypothetical protein
MRLNPPKPSRRRRALTDATVVAYVGWRKAAGRDAYRVWALASAQDVAHRLKMDGTKLRDIPGRADADRAPAEGMAGEPGGDRMAERQPAAGSNT